MHLRQTQDILPLHIHCIYCGEQIERSFLQLKPKDKTKTCNQSNLSLPTDLQVAQLFQNKGASCLLLQLISLLSTRLVTD